MCTHLVYLHIHSTYTCVSVLVTHTYNMSSQYIHYIMYTHTYVYIQTYTQVYRHTDTHVHTHQGLWHNAAAVHTVAHTHGNLKGQINFIPACVTQLVQVVCRFECFSNSCVHLYGFTSQCCEMQQ